MISRFNVRLAALAAGGFMLSGAPAGAAPVISELFYDAAGSDTGVTFVELFGNPGETLDGLVLEGVNGGNGAVYTSLSLSGAIPADGVFVIGDDDGTGSTAVTGADLVGDVDYQNGPDSVVLRDGAAVIDAVGYGSFGASDIFAGEGLPAPDAAAGASLVRINPLLDTDNNGIDFAVADVPTPGIVPSVSNVPLPPALGLLASGLVGLVSAGRARRPG
jgi:hypothetical protein